MSLVDTLHRAHKERLARISSRAYRAPAPALPQKLKARVIVDVPEEPKKIPRSRYVMDTDYEFAWFLEMADSPPPAPESVQVETIIRLVCDYYCVGKVDLFSARRTKNLVLPRQMISYLSKKFTLRSLPEIGRRMGGKDHTTILHGIKQIEKRLLWDTDTREAVEYLSRQLGGQIVTDRIWPKKILKPADVLAIRASREHPSELAERYHCSPMNIRNIKAGRTWGKV